MNSPCIKCSSNKTETYRADDGHFRKECEDCGHIGGPYVEVNKVQSTAKQASQTSLSDW